MKYTEILRKGNCVLVDHEAGQQYIVGVAMILTHQMARNGGMECISRIG